MNYGILILVLFPVVAGVIGYILGRKNEKGALCCRSGDL